MITINATLFIQIMHFIILVYILNRLIFRPILKIIDARTRHIEDEKKMLNNLEEETRELMDKCVSIEREARKKAGEDSNQLKTEANATAENIFSEARQEISTTREAADREIEHKIEEARGSLHSQAELLSEVLIEKIIGRRLAH